MEETVYGKEGRNRELELRQEEEGIRKVEDTVYGKEERKDKSESKNYRQRKGRKAVESEI